MAGVICPVSHQFVIQPSRCVQFHDLFRPGAGGHVVLPVLVPPRSFSLSSHFNDLQARLARFSVIYFCGPFSGAAESQKPRNLRSGDERARTANPWLAKPVLSQLSYVPVKNYAVVSVNLATSAYRLQGGFLRNGKQIYVSLGKY